jgi:hypothetical protein
MSAPRLVLASLLATVVAAPALAQGQGTGQPSRPGIELRSGGKGKKRDPNLRNLIGVVRLPDDAAAEGAVVRLKDMKSGKVRMFITRANGHYEFTELSVNIDYEVRAEYKGMASDDRTLSVYDQRVDPIINLKLDPEKKAAESAAKPGESKKQ